MQSIPPKRSVLASYSRLLSEQCTPLRGECKEANVENVLLLWYNNHKGKMKKGGLGYELSLLR